MASPTLPSPRLVRQPFDLEERRAKSLAELALLDSPDEAEFEGIVALASHVCGAPTALVTLLDRERQWAKALVGSDLKDIPRDMSFCTHATALAVGDHLVVEDATLDPRFAANPLVTGAPFIRFYAGAPIRDALGVVLGAVCVIGPEARGIDAKQRSLLQTLANQVESLMQERLRTRAAQRERNLHELVGDSVRDAVVLFDRQERIFRWNRAAESLFGYRADEAIGQHASLIASQDELGQVSATVIRASLARYGGYSGPHRLRHRSGAVVDVELRVQLVTDEVGNRIFVSTHRETPAGPASRVARVPAPPGPKVTRDDDGFDPSDAIRGVLAQLRDAGRTRHVTVAADLPEGATKFFQHRAAIEEIVLNLVTNAADAIAGVGAKAIGSTICVRLHVDDEGGAELQVEDDGPGMTEELQASIFDPYFTTKPASRGSGLGLPVVARLVTRTLGGKLRLASTPGGGTTVTLTIPASIQGSAAA